MKNQILSIFCAVIFIWSCNPYKKENKVSIVKPDIVITHDQRIIKNTIDINGIYKGTVPCDDCDGIETEIQLNPDFTYVIKTKYLGRNTKKVSEDKGVYNINNDKMIISLEGANKYVFIENTLTQLDLDGNPIKKEMANKYILKKNAP